MQVLLLEKHQDKLGEHKKNERKRKQEKLSMQPPWQGTCLDPLVLTVVCAVQSK